MSKRKWRRFEPKPEMFRSIEEYEDYREHVRCAICHKKLEIGEEFDIRPVQTSEEAGSFTVKAVIVHRKCIEGE